MVGWERRISVETEAWCSGVVGGGATGPKPSLLSDGATQGVDLK